MSESTIVTAMGAILTLISFLVVRILNRIEADIKSLAEDLRDARNQWHVKLDDHQRRHDDAIVVLDRRVSVIESRCQFEHDKRPGPGQIHRAAT